MTDFTKAQIPLKKYTRIGMIRDAVQDSGGTIVAEYANGSGSFGGFSDEGPNAGKVLYKICLSDTTDEQVYDAIAVIELDEQVERAFIATNSRDLKVVFHTSAY